MASLLAESKQNSFRISHRNHRQSFQWHSTAQSGTQVAVGEDEKLFSRAPDPFEILELASHAHSWRKSIR
jgi:hypothetical protein